MKKYYVEIVDNVIDQDLQAKVWDYVQAQTYYASRKVFPFPHTVETIEYVPNQNKKEYLDESLPNYSNQFMHRCSFAVEEVDLQKHPVIQKLWNTINLKFNGKPISAADLRQEFINKLKTEKLNKADAEALRKALNKIIFKTNIGTSFNINFIYIINPIFSIYSNPSLYKHIKFYRY